MISPLFALVDFNFHFYTNTSTFTFCFGFFFFIFWFCCCSAFTSDIDSWVTIELYIIWASCLLFYEMQYTNRGVYHSQNPNDCIIEEPISGIHLFGKKMPEFALQIFRGGNYFAFSVFNKFEGILFWVICPSVKSMESFPRKFKND